MKMTPKQAQDLLKTYKAPFEALNQNVRISLQAEQMNGSGSTTPDKTLHQTIIPMVLKTLEAIANGEPTVSHNTSAPLPSDPSTCLDALIRIKATGTDFSLIAQTFTLFSKGESDEAFLFTFPKGLKAAFEASEAELKAAELAREELERSQMLFEEALTQDTLKAHQDTTTTSSENATKPEPAASSASFYLNCFFGLTMVAGVVLCVAALIALKPLAIVGGLTLLGLGTIGYNPKHSFFSNTDKTPVAEETTANTATV